MMRRTWWPTVNLNSMVVLGFSVDLVVLPGHSDLLVALDPGLVDVRLALSEVGELT